jgi:hypothetical protein
MCLALNMGKMSKVGYLRTAIEETQYWIKKPRNGVQDEKKWSVQFPGHQLVQAVIARGPAMIHQNHTPR